MKITSNIIHFFLSFFIRNIPTVEQADKMGLTHSNNVYGDAINHENCRSWWYDQYNNFYRCDELLPIRKLA